MIRGKLSGSVSYTATIRWKYCERRVRAKWAFSWSGWWWGGGSGRHVRGSGLAMELLQENEKEE
jgi:hypothetical protein